MPGASSIRNQIFLQVEDPVWVFTIHHILDTTRTTLNWGIRRKVEDVLEEALDVPVRRNVRDNRR